jgi:hypothetical protein
LPCPESTYASKETAWVDIYRAIINRARGIYMVACPYERDGWKRRRAEKEGEK